MENQPPVNPCFDVDDEPKICEIMTFRGEVGDDFTAGLGRDMNIHFHVIYSNT